jgi:endonuclease/exonuclease/phosphatase family metal-dependent hydrolase
MRPVVAHSISGNRRVSTLLTLVAILLTAFSLSIEAPYSAAQGLPRGGGALKVMTYNVDEGTDFLEVQAAHSLEEFLVAAGQTITQVRATNPPARMQAVAKQILAAHPTLISLQEVDQWHTGPFDPFTHTCGQTNVEFDMLQELLEALQAQGGHYEVAVQESEFAFPATPALILPATSLCVAFTDSNVILARTDLQGSRFSWSNPQSGQFQAAIPFSTPIGSIVLFRSWVSVDATFHGNAFRFIGTHLETLSDVVRRAQAAELRGVPANTPLPVIVAMDSNAQAFPLPQDTAYLDFIVGGGYADVWSELFPLSSGLTCCQAQFVNNPVSELYQRIDLILTLGNIEPQAIALFGVTPDTKTTDGLWPSDHAGVAAQLEIDGGGS